MGQFCAQWWLIAVATSRVVHEAVGAAAVGGAVGGADST
jgi:hypothetical protein